MDKSLTVLAARRELRRYGNPQKAVILQRFFKTGPGEYAEGDRFLGVVVPDTRKIAKAFSGMSLTETRKLLKGRIHEERLLAILLLVDNYSEADLQGKKKCFEFYLKHTRYINNWDLVDLSAHHIVGAYLADKDRGILRKLAVSPFLWERRIAVIATFYFIRKNDFTDTLKLAKLLLHDGEDLIHKALGWMLREIGKRDIFVLENFILKYKASMPRTMLRYAIEKFPQDKKTQFMK